MRTLRVAAALAAAALLAACSSSTSGKGSTIPTGTGSGGTSASITSAGPVTSPPVTTPAPPVTSPATGGALDAGLLTADDIGTGYQKTPSSTEQSALPCTPNEPPIGTQYPPTTKSSADYVNGDQSIQVSQDIGDLGDEATALKAVAAVEKGFNCKTGTLGGETVTIIASGKVTTAAAIDSGEAWDFSTPTVKATAVLLRKGSKIDTLVFVAKPAAANSLQPRAVVEKAAAKLAALG